MALSDVFLNPLGLAALVAAVPLVALYLVRRDPTKVEIPTVRFLEEGTRQDTTSPVLEQLRRNLLLLIQLLVVALLALSLASPYVVVSKSETVSETVLVVDTSASMATQADGSTRFERGMAAARDAVTGTTSVVTTDLGGRVVLRKGTRREAERTLDGLETVDVEGDLGTAISRANAVAGENARIVVVSDFAATTGWRSAVQTARARGSPVDLRQFAAGGGQNVGIVDRSFSGGNLTVTVKNFGSTPADRTLAVGERRRSLTLQPGDVVSETFRAPAGQSRVRLTPGDSFPVDDTAFVTAPADPSIDVLLVTNDRNRYLVTALSVIDRVNLTVASPPAAIERDYDVVVFSDVNPERLLDGTIQAARDTVASGGGVVVQAQEDLPERLGELLLVEPTGIRAAPTLRTVEADPLTRGMTFSPPNESVSGSLRSGRALVATGNGSPMIAVDDRGPGHVLYYGYIEEASAFKYNYRYPVFWKRAMYRVSGLRTMDELNRETGERLQADGETTIRAPTGPVNASSVTLSEAGYYRVGGQRVSATLLSESESDVAASPLEERSDGSGVATRTEQQLVPRTVTEWVLLAAVLVVALELGFLKYRGDV